MESCAKDARGHTHKHVRAVDVYEEHVLQRVAHLEGLSPEGFVAPDVSASSPLDAGPSLFSAGSGDSDRLLGATSTVLVCFPRLEIYAYIWCHGGSDRQ